MECRFNFSSLDLSQSHVRSNFLLQYKFFLLHFKFGLMITWKQQKMYINKSRSMFYHFTSSWYINFLFVLSKSTFYLTSRNLAIVYFLLLFCIFSFSMLFLLEDEMMFSFKVLIKMARLNNWLHRLNWLESVISRDGIHRQNYCSL